MRQRFAIGLVVLSGLILASSPSRADEETIPADQLPEAVKKAVEAEFPKARIVKASKEEEDKVVTYEVELKQKDTSIDVALKADGTIIEIEKEVPLDSLPKALKKGITARYPKGEILKVESITKGKDGPVRYEVVLKTEVVFTAKGKVVKADDEDDEEDDDKEMKARKKGDKDDDDKKPNAKKKTKADDDDDEDDDDDKKPKGKKKDD